MSQTSHESRKNAEYGLIIGSGEMARAVRTFDWTRTPLGPISGWPRSLITAANICLNLRFPIILFWGPELIPIYNDAIRQVFGASTHPRALGGPGRELWPEIWDTVGAQLHSVLKTGNAASLDDVLLQLNRDFHTEETGFTYSFSPVLLEDGTVGGVFTALSETHRKETEVAGHFLASVVESSADGIITEDLNGMVTSWNSGAQRMFGYSAEEIMGRPISIIIPSGNGNEIPGVLEAVRRGEAIEQYETVRQAKSGNLINVSITWSPLRDAGGCIVGASKVVRDITERKQMEDQRMELLSKERALAMERALRETEAELARVARALSVGELATSIAHEINQPLAGVVTNAEAGLRWLSRETPNIEEAKESLALIVRDGNRASAVIRQIRELLKKERPQPASLNIDEVIEEVVALAHAELTKRQITLYSELARGLPPVRGDRVQLQQVILNLIMNGADAMASIGGPKELFMTSQKSSGGGILVTVRDSGIGINPQDLNRMFEPFFTTKPMGIGMGLSLSRSIVESHGGRIWSQLNEGPGLTVQFSLPADNAGQKSVAASKRL